MTKLFLTFLCISVLQGNCFKQLESKRFSGTFSSADNLIPFDSSIRTIHIMVALCDNKYQGIVPVPAKIGNGQDLKNNLYWGCGYGIRSYFKKSAEWTFIKSIVIDSIKMERLVFKHVSSNVYLIADAYNGKYIKQCTVDFLNACSGLKKDTIHIGNKVIGIHGNARLISYIGHDGLMDFQLPDTFSNKDSKKRDCIILACISKILFSGDTQHRCQSPGMDNGADVSGSLYTP